MLLFRPRYLLLTLILLVTEVLIALYVHDGFVRPYLGDVLVVMLVYCFLRTFLNWKILTTALFTLAFSFLVETLQALNLLEYLGWEDSKLAATLLGNSFAWLDMLAYLAGFVLILLFEKTLIHRSP